ncbi:NAD(P)-dependent oxidoreductase [Myxococcota bacterium]|nr:NAD(P)-dependent oxidoreductase [Myxococcota bacterium]
MTRNLAFLCLGTMGYPMAGHLARAGHRVTVYNRTVERAQAWVEQYGGDFAESPQAAARGAEVVFVCTGNDDDLRQVVLGDAGALVGLEAGALLVDHTTASAELAREIWGRARECGVGFLDAPVSGGQAGAENGKLTVMVGGEESHFQWAANLLDCYAQKRVWMGPTGSGQLAKMANQICIAGLLQGLSEGLAFARRAGIDGGLLVDAISKGAAQSWQMENRAPTMLEGSFDFGFAVDWMRKDLAIALAEAERVGAELPVAGLVDGFYSEVQERGGGRWDTSSLITRLP